MRLPLFVSNVQSLAWYFAGRLRVDLRILYVRGRQNPKLLFYIRRERPSSAGSSVASSATPPIAAARRGWGPGKPLSHITL